MCHWPKQRHLGHEAKLVTVVSGQVMSAGLINGRRMKGKDSELTMNQMEELHKLQWYFLGNIIRRWST